MNLSRKVLPILMVLAVGTAFISSGCASFKAAWEWTKKGCLSFGAWAEKTNGEGPGQTAKTPAASVGWDLRSLDTARKVDYLTEPEKDVMLEMNKLRSDPARYAEEYLVPMRDRYDDLIYREPGQIDLLTT